MVTNRSIHLARGFMSDYAQFRLYTNSRKTPTLHNLTYVSTQISDVYASPACHTIHDTANVQEYLGLITVIASEACSQLCEFISHLYLAYSSNGPSVELS